MKIHADLIHREYKNDFRLFSNRLAERCLIAALPVFAAYLSSNRIVSCSLGLLRTLNEGHKLFNDQTNYHLFQTTLAVIALAGAFFAHPIGNFLISVQDLFIEFGELSKHIQNKDREKALASLTTIIQISLSLIILFNGGLELKIVLHILQSSFEFYKAHRKYYGEGDRIEAVGHLLMAGLRLAQLGEQVRLLKVQWENAKKILLENLEKILKTKITEFSIKDRNGVGEAVGLAQSKKNQIVWLWKPLEGFSVISNSKELKREPKDDVRFVSLKINDKGVVAGTLGRSVKNWINKYQGQFQLFYWTREKGLKINEEPLSPVRVEQFDNEGTVLLVGTTWWREIRKGSWEVTNSSQTTQVANIFDFKNTRSIVLYPEKEINKVATDHLNEHLKSNPGSVLWNLKTTPIQQNLENGKVIAILRVEATVMRYANLTRLRHPHVTPLDFKVEFPQEKQPVFSMLPHQPIELGPSDIF